MKLDYLKFISKPINKDTFEYELTYKIIECEYENTEFDKNNSNVYKLNIELTGPIHAVWIARNFNTEIIDIECFEIGRRFLINKIKTGKLRKEEVCKIKKDDYIMDISKFPILVGKSDYIITANNPLKI
ncbi:MAG: hypothetical protein WC358_03170 [Ignavibacteria bacterium]